VSPWHFDPISALIGAVLALIAAGVAYQLKDPLVRLMERARGTARDLTQKATASAEQRYRERVVAWASRANALSHLASLDQIFVSPPLILPPPHPDPQAQHPPVRRPPVLGSLLRGHPRLAVLGEVGSGRSTLLAYLALLSARGEAPDGPSLPSYRLPLYVRLTDLPWEPPADEVDREDGADLERLVRGALDTVGGTAAHGRALRQGLTAGTGLVLADGWEELEDWQRELAAAWLGRLADSLPGNVWIVTGPPEGFAPLTDAGFVPVRLGPWGPAHARSLLARWEVLLQPPEGEPLPDPAPLDAALNRALRKGGTPLELNLRCWLFFAGGELPSGPAAAFLEATERLLEPPGKEPAWTPAALRAALGHLALTLQQEGRTVLQRQEVEEVLEDALPPVGERPARAEEQAIQTLTGPGNLLRPCGDDGYAFTHPLWQAWLAARQAAALSPTAVLEHLDDPRWLPVLDFYAGVGKMEPVVEAWLSRPDDLWRTRLRRAARWVALAPPDAKWRNGVMALLARTLLSPSLLPPIRRKVAEALVQTDDPGVSYFLTQASRHPLPEVRAVALEALGCAAKETDLPTLEAGLGDEDPRVRAAAVAALDAMDNRAALHLLSRLLVEAEQELQVQAARALAHYGEEGWEFLREALEDEDLLVRRAAVYGLAEVGHPWARERLLDMARDDPEWFVRSAAETVLEGLEVQSRVVVPPPFQVSEAGWLIAWAAERDEPVGRGKAAFTTLLRALREGDPSIRQAAVQTLALVGQPEHLPALRQALEDEDPDVASAALEALEEVCRRYGVTVPLEVEAR